jgi:hypothetical protein
MALTFIQIAQFCKKITNKIDLASKVLEILFFEDINRPLYIINSEFVNVAYYIVEKLTFKISHSGVSFIDLMLSEDTIQEILHTKTIMNLVQNAGRI